MNVFITLIIAAVLLTSGCIIVPRDHDHDGPGNSENAPGHQHDGPGNSENAPGHNKDRY